jgi:hypothetical protein
VGLVRSTLAPASARQDRTALAIASIGAHSVRILHGKEHRDGHTVRVLVHAFFTVPYSCMYLLFPPWRYAPTKPSGSTRISLASRSSCIDSSRPPAVAVAVAAHPRVPTTLMSHLLTPLVLYLRTSVHSHSPSLSSSSPTRAPRPSPPPRPCRPPPSSCARWSRRAPPARRP